MDCPVCKKPMVILELQSVEIDHCNFCGGIWLDSGELELLLEDSIAKEKLLSSFFYDVNNKEQKLKCPICSKNMNKILVGKEKNIVIDKCKNDDGLWFDKGELEEVVKLASLDGENKVLNLLRDMFSHKLKTNPTGGKI